jgi:hypothetical protein
MLPLLKPKPTKESETKYPRLSPEQKDRVLNDLKEHLRITLQFQLRKLGTGPNGLQLPQESSYLVASTGTDKIQGHPLLQRDKRVRC